MNNHKPFKNSCWVSFSELFFWVFLSLHLTLIQGCIFNWFWGTILKTEYLWPMRKEFIFMSSLNGQCNRIIHFLWSVSLGRIYSVFSCSLHSHCNLQENLTWIIKPIYCKNEPARINHCPWQNELLFDKADSSFWAQSSLSWEDIFQGALVSFLPQLLPALYFNSTSSFLIPFSFSFLSP